MTQQEYIGFDAASNLRVILAELGAEKVFLVTGKASFQSSGAEEVLLRLLGQRRIVRFDGFSPNPKIEDVDIGVDLFRREEPDVIVAVGGGSVIDMAKLVLAFSGKSEDMSAILAGEKELRPTFKPFVAIPTTSGAGSEATHFAVLYVNRKKYSISDGALLPSHAIVDPAFTKSLSRQQTAVSGADALSQAIEGYWSVRATEASKSYSREALQLTLFNLPTCVLSPTDQSRLSMARAAYLAGKGINIARTTAPHALSYALTSWFGVQHGQAVGLTLPSFFGFNCRALDNDVQDPRGLRYVQATLDEITALMGCRTVEEGGEYLQSFLKQIGLATGFAELGLDKKKAIEVILSNVNTERLVNNPRKVQVEQMRSILEAL